MIYAKNCKNFFCFFLFQILLIVITYFSLFENIKWLFYVFSIFIVLLFIPVLDFVFFSKEEKENIIWELYKEYDQMGICTITDILMYIFISFSMLYFRHYILGAMLIFITGFSIEIEKILYKFTEKKGASFEKK